MVFMAACAPGNPSAATERATTLKSTLAPAPTLIAFPTIAPSLPPFPTQTPTNIPRPYIISYTTYTDGGDDLFICLQGVAQPQFILYDDGVLIKLEDGYLQSMLSQDEITALLSNISNTGLLHLAEKDFPEGNSVLSVNGKIFHAPWNLPSTDPLAKAIDVVLNFQPKQSSRYIPETLLLEVFSIDKLNETVETYLRQPESDIPAWANSPLSKYVAGWQIISGKDLPIVMGQFDRFPDVHIFRDNDLYYVAAICANYPYR